MRIIKAVPPLTDGTAWRSLAQRFAKGKDGAVSVDVAYAAALFTMLNTALIAACRRFLFPASVPAAAAVSVKS